MDKAFLFYILIGIGFLYFMVNVEKDANASYDGDKSPAYKQEHRFDKYQAEDNVGRSILNVSRADAATQVAAWNQSTFKEEMIDLFPNFDAMKTFAKERIRGDILQHKLLDEIDRVESQYMTGKMTESQVKDALRHL